MEEKRLEKQQTVPTQLSTARFMDDSTRHYNRLEIGRLMELLPEGVAIERTPDGDYRALVVMEKCSDLVKLLELVTIPGGK